VVGFAPWSFGFDSQLVTREPLVLGVEWLSVLGLNFLLVSVSFTLSHTLSLDSFCTPTACQSNSSAELFPLVYAYVVDYTSASPFAYSSSTHRFPDDRTPMEAMPLSEKILFVNGELNLLTPDSGCPIQPGTGHGLSGQALGQC